MRVDFEIESYQFCNLEKLNNVCQEYAAVNPQCCKKLDLEAAVESIKMHVLICDA